MRTGLLTRQLLRGAILLALAVFFITSLAVPAMAQQYKSVRAGGRAGSWDMLLPLSYAESISVSGQGGSSAHIDPGWGLGFGFGYNFTDRFQLGGLWAWNSRTYYANIVTNSGAIRRYSNWMNTSTLQLNGTYYFLDGKISPFLTGGVGITYIDTNIPTTIYSGPSTCWWDPWYGYVCDSYTPTRTENDFSYDLGLGVRIDFERSFALQAGFYRTWIDFSKATNAPTNDIWRLDFVFRMW